MKHVWMTGVVVAAMAGPAWSETTQDKVLTCFAAIGETTDWNGCLNTMFAPCAGHDVGSEAHLECLIVENNGWQAAQSAAEADVMANLNPEGAGELSGLLEAWPKFVDEKCNAVGESRAAISFEAGYLGCQISEYALMTNELTACLDGRSTEDYCQTE